SHERDPEPIAFLDRAAQLVTRVLQSSDDENLRSVLLRGLASREGPVRPRQAELHLREAMAMSGASPLNRLSALHNLLFFSCVLGPIEGGVELSRWIDALVAQVPGQHNLGASMHATLAVVNGDWEEALHLADAVDGGDLLDRLDMAAVRTEALTALGRYDDAQ